MKKLLIGLLAVTLIACDDDDNDNDTNTVDTATQNNIDLREIIDIKSLTGDPMTGRTIPSITSSTAQLGMDLFFSKSLGGDQDSACVTCHHPTLGGGDDLSLPIGVEADDPDLLGPGRSNNTADFNPEGGPPVPRNAPTTFNVVGWDAVLFHDGRVESIAKTAGKNGAGAEGIRTPDSALGVADPLAGQNLVQAQARFPVTSPEEMKGFNHDIYDNQGIREFLAGRVGDYGDAAGELSNPDFWLDKFRTVFNQPAGTAENLITEQNISLVIGDYERSQVFIESPWKEYVEGNDDAITESAKEGALLFFRSKAEGGADCTACHTGDFFTDEGFHNIAMPQIGPGKGDGDDTTEDFGRFRETGVASDMFAFRTPSLLNVEVTGPWTHAGSYTSLTAVVKHHLNSQDAIDNYDFAQLTQTEIRNIDKLAVNTQKALDANTFELEVVDFTDEQVDNIVEFLHSLTDPCVKDRDCLAPWIPDPAVSDDPNGHQLTAIAEDGTTM